MRAQGKQEYTNQLAQEQVQAAGAGYPVPAFAEPH